MNNRLTGLLILVTLGLILTVIIFSTMYYYNIVDQLTVIDNQLKVINDQNQTYLYTHPDSIKNISPKTIDLSPPKGKASKADIFLIIVWSCIIGGAGGIGVYLVKLKEDAKVNAHKILGHAFTCMIAGIIGVSGSYYVYQEIIIIMALGYGASSSLIIAIFDIHEIKEFLSEIFSGIRNKFFGERRNLD